MRSASLRTQPVQGGQVLPRVPAPGRASRRKVPEAARAGPQWVLAWVPLAATTPAQGERALAVRAPPVQLPLAAILSSDS
jgi:hypothetical protein